MIISSGILNSINRFSNSSITWPAAPLPELMTNFIGLIFAGVI
ncbi:Uncharacterised protein [Vibrio cholerae]|nr:Uncharacterised protein [Vibrio cholerae]